MLGKLMKHEFRATGRIMLPLLGAELLLSVLAGLSIRGLDRIENMNFLGVTYITTLAVFFLGLFALAVVAFVLMIQRFYRNLLRDEGYLAMTLPVSVDAQIWSKLLVSFVWFLAVGVLSVVTMLILLALGARVNLLRDMFFDEQLREVIREITSHVGGGNIVLFALESVVLFFLGTCATCLRCYSALAIGHSAADHKLLLSFVTYFIIGMALSLLSNAVSFGVLPHLDLDRLLMNIDTLEGGLRFAHGSLWVGVALSLVYSAIFYFVTRWFLKNKLNLA